MNNKLIGVLISVVVGVILVGSLLAPVINDNTVKTYINAADTTLDAVNDEVSGSVDLTDGIAITINGETVNKYASNWRVTIFESDTLRIGIDSSTNQGVLDYWNGTTATHMTNIFKTISFEVADKSVEATYVKPDDTSVSFTIPYSDWAFVIANNGEYADISVYNGGTIYYEDASDVYSGYYTYTSGYWYSFNGTSAKVNGTTATVNYSDSALDGSDGYSAAIGFNSSDISVTFLAGSTETTANVFNVIVPLRVTVDLDNGLGLMSVIPVLVLVSLIVMVVRIFSGRSD